MSQGQDVRTPRTLDHVQARASSRPPDSPHLPKTPALGSPTLPSNQGLERLRSGQEPHS